MTDHSMRVTEQEKTDALKVLCPKCGAMPGVRCRTKEYQKAIQVPHKDRILLGRPRPEVPHDLKKDW